MTNVQQAPAGVDQSAISLDDSTWDRFDHQLAWHDCMSVVAQRAYKLVKLAQLLIGAAGLSSPCLPTGKPSPRAWPSLSWSPREGSSSSYLATGSYAGGAREKILAQRVERLAPQETVRWAATLEKAGGARS
ncbi:MAG: hypothetical protein WAK86_15585 [Pseudonocardiaceae bacterium]